MEGFPTDTLGHNTALFVNQELVSFNGMYRLVYQGDGNLVGYPTAVNGNTQAFWASGVLTNHPHKAIIQSDGNLVCYDASDKPYWASNTNGKGRGPYKLVMQSDKNICIYDVNDSPTWASNTSTTETPRSELGNGEALGVNQHIISRSGMFRLVYQTDGNLVGYRKGGSSPSYAFWASGILVSNPGKAVMQRDGNLVCYNTNGKPYFATNTCGKGSAPFKLAMQDDRNVCVYDSYNKATWASGSCSPLTSLSILGDNKQLLPHFQLQSDNGEFRLVYQTDGNLVGYLTGGRGSTQAFWASGKLLPNPGRAIMQSDGNLVCYDSNNHAYFATNSCGVGVGPFKLVMENNRNIRIIDARGTVTWESRTAK